MREYKIKIIDSAPDWNKIDALSIDNRYLDTPSTITANAQICCNEEKFIVHLTTTEKNYLREEKGATGLPYLDSCLEFFFSPMENDTRYFNVEFNSNACVFFGFSGGADSIMRQTPENDILDFFKPNIITNEDNWEIYYEIPFYLIRRYFPEFEVYEGKKIRANCFKCSDNSTPPHYMSWSLVEGNPFTFHKPECFGLMTFVK